MWCSLEGVQQEGGAIMWCSLEGLQKERVQECGAAWRECSRKGCNNVVQPGGTTAGKGARMWCSLEGVQAGRGARMWCSLEGVQQEGVQECGAAWKI
jgi:hypothetical protein